MSSDVQALIESAVGGNKEDLRTLLTQFYDQNQMLNAATGNSWLQPTNNNKQKAQTKPPAQAGISVTGSNGSYQIQITNPAQAVSATIIHEISYSPIKSFGGNVTTLPQSSSTSYTVPSPGATVYFRFRSSFDG